MFRVIIAVLSVFFLVLIVRKLYPEFICSYIPALPSSSIPIPVIIWWTPNIFPHFLEDSSSDSVVISCHSLECVSTKKRTHYEENSRKSDGAVTTFMFYGTDLRVNDLPLASKNDPRVLWALLHEESPMNNYVLSHEPMIELFNFTSTFSRHSDHPLTTLFVPSVAYLMDRNPVPLHRKNRLRSRLAPVLYVQSNCDVSSDRDAYVAELGKFVPIDSYGKCLHNADLPSELLSNGSDGYDTDEFLDFIADYKFHLAFENALCDDYVTEKLFRAFHVGSVPIYRGSGSVADWAPALGTIVDVGDFQTPDRLAEFILDVDADDVLYERYLSFKGPDGIRNEELVHVLASRPWTVGSETDSKIDFVSSYECFVCERMHEIRDRLVAGESVPSKVADGSHLGCPEPTPALDSTITTSNIRTWIDNYLRSSEIARALQRMARKEDYDSTELHFYVNKSEL